MSSGAVAGLLAVAMPSMANAGQYFCYAGSYTSEPSSGTPPRVVIFKINRQTDHLNPLYPQKRLSQLGGIALVSVAD
jgi:hypothetical protein